MPDIRHPVTPCLVSAIGHIVSELDVLSAVEAEPRLLEGGLDRTRVGGHVAEHVLELALGVFGAFDWSGVEAAGEDPAEHGGGRHRLEVGYRGGRR